MILKKDENKQLDEDSANQDSAMEKRFLITLFPAFSITSSNTVQFKKIKGI